MKKVREYCEALNTRESEAMPETEKERISWKTLWATIGADITAHV